VWLAQSIASSTGLDPANLVWGLAAVVSAISLKLVSVWQERVKTAEAKATKLADEILEGKDKEIAFWKGRALDLDAKMDAAQEKGAKNLDTILGAIANLKTKGGTMPPRSDTPMPHTGYSISTTNPKKTPPSRLR